MIKMGFLVSQQSKKHTGNMPKRSSLPLTGQLRMGCAWYQLRLKMKEMFNENVEDIKEFGN